MLFIKKNFEYKHKRRAEYWLIGVIAHRGECGPTSLKRNWYLQFLRKAVGMVASTYWLPFIYINIVAILTRKCETKSEHAPVRTLAAS